MLNKAEISDNGLNDDDDVADQDFSPETVGTDTLDNNGLEEETYLCQSMKKQMFLISSQRKPLPINTEYEQKI